MSAPPPPSPPADAATPTTPALVGGKWSAWMVHVKKTMKAHKGMKLGTALKLASKTFKKSLRGGAGGVGATALPVGGRRRRRGSTRRSRKH